MTYVQQAKLTVDVGTTDATIECESTAIGLVADQNTRSHPRTGCTPPYDEYVDASYSMEIAYAHQYGTDGLYTIFEALKGTTVSFQLETEAGINTVDKPVFTFDAVVPALSPLPNTEMGEFAVGDVSFPIIGVPVTVAPAAAAAKAPAKK